MPDRDSFWFNRFVQYWTVPLRFDLVDLVSRARLQVVQTGTLGPQFYGLADDPTADRQWAGMPLVGVRENLGMFAALVPRLQEAGAKVVSQMSLAWHYGDQEKGAGLWDSWERIWTDDLLGQMPCQVEDTLQRLPDGSLRAWKIEGRPYRTYSGCLSNPHWRTVMKAMVKKAIGLGVDGIMAHHNFEYLCSCDYCARHLRSRLGGVFVTDELNALFGTAALEEAEILMPLEGCGEALKRRFRLELLRAAHLQRKALFDEVLSDYGRRLKPDLMLAQWYHKYDFRPDNDERFLLPAESWARGEDYLWYSQGGAKGFSAMAMGHLADMGLPSRYLYAGGGGRPFVVNKYDSRRYRLSIGEAIANHAATLPVHWGDGYTGLLEDYIGPLVRYHDFMAEQEPFIHPARPWSQIGLVFPRRAELEGELACGEPHKRLGRIMEDGHLLFDTIFDQQLLEGMRRYGALLLPGIERLSGTEIDALIAFVEEGGRLVTTASTARLDEEGNPHPESVRARWQALPPERVLHLAELSCAIDIAPIRESQAQLFPRPDEDHFGRDFLRALRRLLGELWMETDAPWFVRVRGWEPERESAIVLHWVNYRQEEDSAIEAPRPTAALQATCRVPTGRTLKRVEWRYPEMQAPVILDHEVRDGRVRFAIPSVIVYGMCVIFLD